MVFRAALRRASQPGPRALGGSRVRMHEGTPQEMAAQAAIRRAQDNLWCSHQPEDGEKDDEDDDDDDDVHIVKLAKSATLSASRERLAPTNIPVTAGGHATTPQQTASWACRTCTLINSSERIICDACSSPRGVGVVCSACTFVNVGLTAACVVCATPIGNQ